MTPKISIIYPTIRKNYPFRNRPDIHLFHPLIDSLNKQSFHDIEIIIIDWFYEKRKNIFKKLNPQYQIKHIPAKPNLWLEKGLPGISTQYNKGLTYVDGELIWFYVDGFIFLEDTLKQAWDLHKQGHVPVAWYVSDWSCGRQDDKDAVTRLNKERFKPKLTYTDLYGYKGEIVEYDHRYEIAFKDNPEDLFCHSWWSWYFTGCAGVSLNDTLKLNGFDMNFDGDKALCDVDFGSRLDLIKPNRFVLHKNFYMARLPPSDYRVAGDPKLTIKCTYGLIGFNRTHKIIEANKYYLREKDITWIKQEWCGKRCEMREFCKVNHPWQYPFEHKHDPPKHTANKELFEFWLDNQQFWSLRHERKLRLEGNPKYQEGTFIG